jgi:hypothetical protein
VVDLLHFAIVAHSFSFCATHIFVVSTACHVECCQYGSFLFTLAFGLLCGCAFTS